MFNISIIISIVSIFIGGVIVEVVCDIWCKKYEKLLVFLRS